MKIRFLYYYYFHGLYLGEFPQNLLQFYAFGQVEIYTIFFLYKEFILHANRTAMLKLAKF